jgi:hypothetical protein
MGGRILGAGYPALKEGTTMAEERGAAGTWWVAIDIGKHFHAVLVEGPDGKRQRFQMASTAEDYDRLA